MSRTAARKTKLLSKDITQSRRVWNKKNRRYSWNSAILTWPPAALRCCILGNFLLGQNLYQAKEIISRDIWTPQGNPRGLRDSYTEPVGHLSWQWQMGGVICGIYNSDYGCITFLFNAGENSFSAKTTRSYITGFVIQRSPSFPPICKNTVK